MLSVIVFHISAPLLPGGFVGVDIFFVISGYLITLHIVSEIDRGRFSLAEFYRRRIKRIVPAMLVGVAVTLFVSQMLMRPPDAEKVAESALWSLLSLANVYFWLFQDNGYFAASSAEQPLLHLWSLGVEEQFYIVWPLLLMAVYSASRRLGFCLVMLGVAAASFVLGEWYFERDPSFVYYMLPTRAGELLVGALLAHLVTANPSWLRRAWVGQVASYAGLVLVLASLWWLSEDRVFPGLQAVPPTVGTALLLLAGHQHTTMVSRFFALRPLVWVGLVSYSAYLIHWPLLAFLRYARVELDAVVGTIVLIATLALAAANYRFVEQPLRRTNRGAMAVFLRQFVVPVAVLGVAALGAMKLDGFGPRAFAGDYPQRLETVRENAKPPFAYDYVCQKQVITQADFDDPRCRVGESTAPSVLLVGDSIAAQYVGMLGAFGKAAGFGFHNVAASACPTVIGDPSAFITAPRVANCRASLDAILPALSDYDVIVVGSAWSYYQGRSDQFFEVFSTTMAPLLAAGKQIVVIAKPPLIPGYDRLCREKVLSLPFMDCSMPDVPFDEDVRRGNEQLAAWAAHTPRVTYFDPNGVLCPEGRCQVIADDGRPIFYDRSHLTIPASWDLGESIVRDQGVPEVFLKLGRPAR